jgi:hypothetical protein
MIREQTLRAREKLVSKLPISGELLRGTLLERTVWHTKNCPKCARGEGHRVFVLTVTYPGGRTRQISVRREGVAEVRHWLINYQEKGRSRRSASSTMICCARSEPHRSRGGGMIAMRRRQLSFAQRRQARLSLFEPSTEVIRQGKTAKPNEFGKMVKLQEAENQIITDYQVYSRRPYDSDL